MPLYVYSPENLPDFRPGFSREYIEADGFVIGPLKAGEWHELDTKRRRVFSDYQDKHGREVMLTDKDAANFIRERFAERGLVVATDLELHTKREELEREARERNLEFRKRLVSEYEFQADEARNAGRKVPPVSKYLEESYRMLDMTNPYSFEAIQAARNPGNAVAQDIAKALTDALAPFVQLLKQIAESQNPPPPAPKRTVESEADDREVDFSVDEPAA